MGNIAEDSGKDSGLPVVLKWMFNPDNLDVKAKETARDQKMWIHLVMHGYRGCQDVMVLSWGFFKSGLSTSFHSCFVEGAGMASG